MVEVHRFLRRWGPVTLLAAPAVIAGAGVGLVTWGANPYEPSWAGPGRGGVLCAEFVALSLLAYWLGVRCIGDELERGAWPLLCQAPVTMSGLLGGKLLAAGLLLLCSHSLAWLPLVSPSASGPLPMLRLLAEYVVVLAYASGFLPEGLLVGRVARPTRARTWMVRGLMLVRILVPFVFLAALVDPLRTFDRADYPEVNEDASRLVLAASVLWFDLPQFAGLLPQPWVALLGVLSWQMITAVGYWRRAVEEVEAGRA